MDGPHAMITRITTVHLPSTKTAQCLAMHHHLTSTTTLGPTTGDRTRASQHMPSRSILTAVVQTPV